MEPCDLVTVSFLALSVYIFSEPGKERGRYYNTRGGTTRLKVCLLERTLNREKITKYLSGNRGGE
jgi:hypothetical protein